MSYAHNMFANAATTKTSSISTATLLSRFTTTTHSTHLPKLKIDAPEWDPSRDEVYKAPVSGRWGAVGRERHIRRQLESIWSAPPWRPFEHRKGAPWTALDAYLRTARASPFDSLHMRTGEDEAKSWRAATQQRRKATYRRCEREAMEELTESFNPFNPVNVAARAAAETRLASGQHARHSVAPVEGRCVEHVSVMVSGTDTLNAIARTAGPCTPPPPPSHPDTETTDGSSPRSTVTASPTSSAISTPAASRGSSPLTVGDSPPLEFSASVRCTGCAPDDLWLHASLKRRTREPEHLDLCDDEHLSGRDVCCFADA